MTSALLWLWNLPDVWWFPFALVILVVIAGGCGEVEQD